MTNSPHAEATWVGTREHYAWLQGIVKAVLVFNLLDGILTLFWIHNGFAKEANVLLRDLVNNHPILFALTKLALVSLGSLLLWNRRTHPTAVIGLFFAFIAYYAIVAYHLTYSSILFSRLLRV